MAKESVRLSVCVSVRRTVQAANLSKQSNLGSQNLHRRLPEKL